MQGIERRRVEGSDRVERHYPITMTVTMTATASSRASEYNDSELLGIEIFRVVPKGTRSLFPLLY